MSVVDYSSLSKEGPERSLLAPLKKNSGRNSYGRITVRHKGGGNRRKYRIIDFKRDKNDMFATVLTLEYDPNRTANIALIQYEDGEKRYIIAPHGLKVGDKVVTIGGICGKVSKIKDEFVFIETGNIGTQDEKSVIKMERDAIRTVESSKN